MGKKSKVVYAILLVIAGMFIGLGAGYTYHTIVDNMTVVGQVNGVDIKKGEVAEYVNARMNTLTLGYIKDKIQSDALSELGIRVSADELNEEYSKQVNDAGGVEQFEKQLIADGYSDEQYKYNIGRTLLSKKATEYFVGKQIISAEAIEELYNKRVEGNNEIAIMNCKTIELTAEESGETVKFDELDQSRAKEETNIQTNTVFKQVPAVDAEAVTTIGDKQVLVKVTEVHRGLDDEVVHNYVEDILKQEGANAEYQKYIEEKTRNASIKLVAFNKQLMDGIEKSPEPVEDTTETANNK